MLSKKRKIYGSGLLLAGFAVMAYLVRERLFTGPDMAITRLLQNIIFRTLDTPLSLFSLFGSSEITVIIVGVIAAIVYWKAGKILYGAGLFFVIYVFELIGKLFIYHPGPPKEFFRYELPIVFPSAYVHTNYSFPSGHVSRTAFILILLAFVTWKIFPLKSRNKFYIGYVIFFLFMAISRVYLGEHWFSDVLGGMFLGSSLGLLATALY